jgi:hypothetical protein
MVSWRFEAPDRRALVWVLWVAAASVVGCSQEKAEVYRVPKEAPAAVAAPSDDPHAGLPPEMRPGATPPGGMPSEMPAGMPSGVPEDGGLPVHWHAPSNWTVKPPSSMRVGSYEVPGSGGPGDMSVVVLSGQAGGALPNVNRWRGQIGLGPLADESELAQQSTQVKSPAGNFLVVDFGAGSGGSRVLAAILESEGETWFFKLTGPDGTVGEAKPAFTGLLESVHVRSPE